MKKFTYQVLFLLCILVVDKTPIYAQEQTTNEVVNVVGAKAEFPGGNLELNKFISNNLKYPKEARREHAEGQVMISFVIDKEGNVTDVKATKKVHPQLDEAAIEVIKKLPKWQPATADGKPVRSLYRIPINFTIQSK